MAAVNKFVVSNCLCFMWNKFGKIALKPLKVLIYEFYSCEEIAEAKELLLSEIDLLKLQNAPKITRRRRDSIAGKAMLDIDDIVTGIMFIDEHHLGDNCCFRVYKPGKDACYSSR